MLPQELRRRRLFQKPLQQLLYRRLYQPVLLRLGEAQHQRPAPNSDRKLNNCISLNSTGQLILEAYNIIKIYLLVALLRDWILTKLHCLKQRVVMSFLPLNLRHVKPQQQEQRQQK